MTLREWYWGPEIVLGALLVVLLPACGGGDTSPPPEVPAVEAPSNDPARAAVELLPPEAASVDGVGAVVPESADEGGELSGELVALLRGSAARDRERSNPLSGQDEAIQRGREEYQSVCFPCHGPEGQGNGPAAKALPVKPSNLADPVRGGKLSEGDRFIVMKNGIPGTNMQAFGASLSDDQIWRILAYVETLR